jgi:hypothetical protein
MYSSLEKQTAQVKQSFQSDSDPDYVGFRRNPTKHGRDSIGLYAVTVVSDDRNPTERIPTTHSRDPTEIIWIRWDPTGHNWPGCPLFYIKIKSFSVLLKSSHGEKLPDKWPENYWLKKSSSGAFSNTLNFGTSFKVNKIKTI